MTTIPKEKSREYQRAWRAKHPEQARETQRKWSEKNRKHHNDLKRKWDNEHPEQTREFRKRWNKEHPKELREMANRHVRKKRALVRALVLDHYDNKCACCGETTKEFLGIDHVLGKIPGQQFRRGKLLYDWLIKNNFPDGFQVLCHNCNMAKGFYGICPHKKDKSLIFNSGGKIT